MKIIFFDYSLKGVNNFIRLMPELSAAFPLAEIKLIHLSSWREKIINKTVDFEKFKAYDISYFHTNSLYKILKSEKPDLVVTLNNYLLLDKAVNVFCRHLSIPIIYLSHGRLTGKNVAASLPSFKRNLKKNPIKITPENFYYLKNYLKSTFLQKKPFRFVKSVWALATKPGSMLSSSKYTDELKVDKNLVYFPSCKEILVNERKFPPQNIHIVGNPEFDGFLKDQILDKSLLSPSFDTPVKYILYLEDGFLQNGMMTLPQWKNHIREINKLVRDSGRKLAIKFHPRTDILPLKEFLRTEEIEAFDKSSHMKSMIFHSDGVISVFSTTITFALLLKKRVFSPRWAETAEIAKSYPDNVIKYAYSPKEMANYIQNMTETNLDPSFIEDQLGNPDGNSVYRIVNHFRDTLSKKD